LNTNYLFQTNSSVYKYQTKVSLPPAPLLSLIETLHCHCSQKITTVVSSLHNMGKQTTIQAPCNIDLDQHDGLMLKSHTRTDCGRSERQKLIG
jgi:hypothetical protein